MKWNTLLGAFWYTVSSNLAAKLLKRESSAFVLGSVTHSFSTITLIFREWVHENNRLLYFEIHSRKLTERCDMLEYKDMVWWKRIVLFYTYIFWTRVFRSSALSWLRQSSTGMPTCGGAAMAQWSWWRDDKPVQGCGEGVESCCVARAIERLILRGLFFSFMPCVLLSCMFVQSFLQVWLHSSVLLVCL